ncbi:hypothetical protein F4775DRAFT_597317 [Biscogniauxia sp. FL1348]|nr:hypothetical protein F4775DRAFT_597317 [Biscogniauxia sp. FL1348]
MSFEESNSESKPLDHGNLLDPPPPYSQAPQIQGTDATENRVSHGNIRDEITSDRAHSPLRDELVIDPPGPSNAKDRRKARKNAKKKEKKALQKTLTQSEDSHKMFYDYYEEPDTDYYINRDAWNQRRRRDEETATNFDGLLRWEVILHNAQKVSIPSGLKPEPIPNAKETTGEQSMQLKEPDDVDTKSNDQENKTEERRHQPSAVQPQPPRSTNSDGESTREAKGKTKVCKEPEESLPKAPSPSELETQKTVS